MTDNVPKKGEPLHDKHSLRVLAGSIDLPSALNQPQTDLKAPQTDLKSPSEIEERIVIMNVPWFSKDNSSI